ncbi:TetR family transcriptional regulator C-terminal domain-containing protein [Variovorax sp. YR216]|uniref:TetR family transcriptional regulator C-terminal domain-containing protein n=1 Tax=Variovorax sp. YR216 TaxID=1882828 RepID=UPI0008946439|nr:TetR family transcriptional regulator C-terminal domain-containing protein [Variovorax sp. YR216]SEB25749.1 transcriptional regulator, TetR family [Variovorax sp. YR216]
MLTAPPAPAPQDRRSTDSATRRAETMDRIYIAALEQFSLYGLRGTSTQQIAERAGLSKQQLHYYIESKEALYENILRQTVQHWGHIGLSAEDDRDDPAAVLERVVRRKLDFTLEYPHVSRLFTSEIMSGGQAIRGIWENGRGPVREAERVIGRWVDKGRISPVEPLHLLFHIWALTQHYADYEMQVRFFTGRAAEQALDRELICAEILKLVLRGVGLTYPPQDGKKRAPRKQPGD